MSCVIAIDVGIKNLGICVYDFRYNKIVEWDNVALVPSGRYLPSQNVMYVREFVRRYRQYFNNAFQVLIERQMRCNMRIIESVIQSLYFEACTIINARSVKAHYDLSTRNYRLNKQKAIEWVEQYIERNSEIFASNPMLLRRFRSARKRDDLADSLLLLLYYLDTYSHQLEPAEVILTTETVADGAVE